jgi:hypothetical protein
LSYWYFHVSLAEGGIAMKPALIAKQPPVLHGRYHATDRFKALAGSMVSLFHHTLRRNREHEPTVEQIVDRIMTTGCGGSCEVKLNPRISRVDNLKWLLPLCVGQFGTAIAISEQTEGDQVVLTILVTACKHTKAGQPASSRRQDPVPTDLLLEKVV